MFFHFTDKSEIFEKCPRDLELKSSQVVTGPVLLNYISAFENPFQKNQINIENVD